MANHAWITLKNPITTPQLRRAVREIAEDKFRALLTIEDMPKGCVVGYDWGGNKNVCAGDIPIWMASAKKIEIRHQHRGDLMWWIDASIGNALGLKFKGTMWDDGVGRMGAPKKDFYPTFESWVNMMHAHIEKTPEYAQYVRKFAFEHVPQAMLEIGK